MLFPEVVRLNERDWVDCVDCGGDAELYMVHDHVWPVPFDFGWLCIPCLETRLGRRLAPTDFTDVPANTPSKAAPHLRDRLLSLRS